MCYLLGIREPAQLRLHPLRGAVFASWVVAEVYKTQANKGRQPALFHYLESRGIEIALVEYGLALDALEIKSGQPWWPTSSSICHASPSDSGR